MIRRMDSQLSHDGPRPSSLERTERLGGADAAGRAALGLRAREADRAAFLARLSGRQEGLVAARRAGLRVLSELRNRRLIRQRSAIACPNNP